MDGPPAVDPDRLKEFAKRVFGTLQGAVTAGMIHLGDRLGLYRALAAAPATSDELAERTGLHERWVREWLRQQGRRGPARTSTPTSASRSTPEAVAVLADEQHPAFGGGLFSQLPQTMAVLERLPEAFDDRPRPPLRRLRARGGTGHRARLRTLVPDLPGAGRDRGPRRRDASASRPEARWRTSAAAEASRCSSWRRRFPRAELHGYDLSKHAIARAETNRVEAGVGNVRFHDARGEALPSDASFDLVLTFDCLHDMTRPAEVAAAIRRALRPEGTWLIADIKARGSLAADVEKNPMAALMYGMSVLSCMSSALSEPGGAGLGTLGLPEALAEEMSRGAGFTRFRALDFGHPINAFYEVRP